MKIFKGDMTLAQIEALQAKGYDVVTDADSEYLDINKAKKDD